MASLQVLHLRKTKTDKNPRYSFLGHGKNSQSQLRGYTQLNIVVLCTNDVCNGSAIGESSCGTAVGREIDAVGREVCPGEGNQVVVVAGIDQRITEHKGGGGKTGQNLQIDHSH